MGGMVIEVWFIAQLTAGGALRWKNASLLGLGDGFTRGRSAGSARVEEGLTRKDSMLSKVPGVGKSELGAGL